MTAPAQPLVSIGVPVHNGAKYLPRALESLLAQEWPLLDILVSDNASTDGSAAVADAYAAGDRRIRVVRSDTNVGFEANFSRVLAAARGTYFMWAACDDWWHPAFVSRLVDALERAPRSVVAMSAVERIDEGGMPIDLVRYAGMADPSRMKAWNLVMQLAGGRPYHLFIYGLYRTAFVKRAFTGFAPVVAADRLFMCRVAMAGGFAYVDEALHRRTIRQTTIAERYPHEDLGQLWRAGWPRLRLALAAGPYLWRSPVIPPWRRTWVIPIVLRFIKAAVGHGFVQAGLLRRQHPTSSPT